MTSGFLANLQRMGQSKAMPDFIVKLYSILEQNGYAKIICWSDDNLDVQIKNPQRLQQVVLPHYFRHSKFQSFVRQLNMYGFTKHNRLSHRNSIFFRNVHFRKGDAESLMQIKRNRKTGKQPTQETSNSAINEEPPKETTACSPDRNLPDPIVQNIGELADEIVRLGQLHPQLQPDMRRIMELAGKVVQSCGMNPLPSIKEVQPQSHPNMFQTVREMPKLNTDKSICSFGEHAEDSE